MMIAWIIGLILSLLGIYLFKGSRTPDKKDYYGKVTRPGGPILKVWSLLLYLLGALVPIFNILMGIVMIIWWAIAVYGDEDWVYSEESIANKIVQFLNKSVK